MSTKRATRTPPSARPRARVRIVQPGEAAPPTLDPEELMEIERHHGIAARVEAEHRWHRQIVHGRSN